MANKFHMKKDESGVAICNASVKDCPNGDFGHWDTEEEVWTAYEASNYDKTFSKTLNKKDIKDKARRNLADEKKQALDLLRNAQDDDDKNIALSMIPGKDYIWDKFSESDDPAERMWSARKIDGSKSAIIDFIENENNPDVLMAFSENTSLEKDQAKRVYNKLKYVKSYDLQDQHFVKDYARTMKLMRDSEDKASSDVTANQSDKKVIADSKDSDSQSSSNKTPVEKWNDSKKVSKIVLSSEFGKDFYKAQNSLKAELKEKINKENISDKEKSDFKNAMSQLEQAHFAANRKTSLLMGGGTQSFSFIAKNDVNLSDIPNSLIDKHFGKLFSQNNISYTMTRTNKSINFSFMSEDELKNLNVDLDSVNRNR